MLENIQTPADLRHYELSDLPAIATELRHYLLDTVSQIGGHLSASLGTVEMTLALHYVLDTPHDRLVWDVGHQAYGHKVLTGRRDTLKTIRRQNGLAGFPKRAESEYDTFGVGHSSTSIGAALGMALASAYKGEKRRHVAVIGDGAMTAGMAYEALHHAGDQDADLLVILNDNDMSISPNVGGLNRYFTRLLSGRFYTSMRESGKRVLNPVPPMKEFARRAEEHMKGMVAPSTLFEEMGLHYFGPVDGHDVQELVRILRNIQDYPGPRLLHIVTKKGYGYLPAEEDPCKYHGVSPFNPEQGIQSTPPKADDTPTYTEVFSQWLCDMAEQDERLFGITPAMREGSGLVEFSRRFPKRYHDVAIAEQHAVTLAAGLACEGMKPVVAIYSTFLQRAYDQLIHDVALQNLDILFAIDRAGLVGPDGPTHAGSFDLSYLRCIPNMVIMAASNEDECRQMLYTGYDYAGPAAVRYPRGKGAGIQPQTEMHALEIGCGERLRHGKDVALLVFGAPLQAALEAAESLSATVANMRFVKPLDRELIKSLAAEHRYLITVEENAIAGGAGSAVNEYLQQQGILMPVLNLGLPDYYQDHGNREELLAECGLDAQGIEKAIKGFIHS